MTTRNTLGAVRQDERKRATKRKRPTMTREALCQAWQERETRARDNK